MMIQVAVAFTQSMTLPTAREKERGWLRAHRDTHLLRVSLPFLLLVVIEILLRAGWRYKKSRQAMHDHFLL